MIKEINIKNFCRHLDIEEKFIYIFIHIKESYLIFLNYIFLGYILIIDYNINFLRKTILLQCCYYSIYKKLFYFI